MEENIAKVICLVILIVSSIAFGCLPYLLVRGGAVTERSVRIRGVIMSYLNCFAGGVFLGACLLHLLAEGSEEMDDYFKNTTRYEDGGPNFPVYNSIVACGIFIISGVEMIAHSLLHGHNHDNHSYSHVQTNRDGTKRLPGIGHDESVTESGATESTPILAKPGNGAFGEQKTHSEEEMEGLIKAMNATPLRAFLLLAAMSFHTVFDGLAVGLQTSSQGVWEMFAAISIHKCLVAVCIGLQLFMVYHRKVWKAVFWVVIFALIAPIGTGVGIIVTSGAIDLQAKRLVGSILQALATGTFLYVTFFEILKDELVEKRGFLRLCIVILGFGGMALAKGLDKD